MTHSFTLKTLIFKLQSFKIQLYLCEWELPKYLPSDNFFKLRISKF